MFSKSVFVIDEKVRDVVLLIEVGAGFGFFNLILFSH